MSAGLAVQAGLTLWSFRRPLFYAAALAVAAPLLLIGLVAAVFAPLPGPGHPLSDPLPGAPLSQGFGCTSLDIEPWSDACPTHHFHSGVDLGAPTGTPVYAAAPGEAAVGLMPDGYGLFVVVRRDTALSTLYAHLSQVQVVSGDLVTAGEVLGEVGSTGRSSGPHLHFEVQVAGHPIDPIPMLPVRAGPGGDARPHP